MSYVICEYEKVKDNFPEFKDTMEDLSIQLKALCIANWGMPFGGLTPTAGQFGETTILPVLFNDMGGAQLNTWDQWLTATGAQTIMTGHGTGGIIQKNYKIGLAGLVFLDKAIRISEIKMQISDKKLPRINIEEALVYNKPAIVFEQGYILDENTGFDLDAYVTTRGPQRIKLLGLQMSKIPNQLQITNTGATL